jgi:hypothetical protein
MDYSDYLLWIELCTVAIVFGIGLWSFTVAHRRAEKRRGAKLGGGRRYDMRRDGQRLSLD